LRDQETVQCTNRPTALSCHQHPNFAPKPQFQLLPSRRMRAIILLLKEILIKADAGRSAESMRVTMTGRA